MKVGVESLRLLFISALLSKDVIAKVNIEDNCVSNLFARRLPTEDFECRHYNIKLILPTYSKYDIHYDMELNYFIEIRNITESISIHYDTRYEIDETKTRLWADRKYPLYYMNYPIHYIYCSETEILSIYFVTEIYPGNYTLDMTIVGVLSNDSTEGLSKISIKETTNQTTFFATNFLWKARRVFPCFDEPSLRATFNISVKHLGSYTALSNMFLREREEIFEEKAVWSHFHTTPLLPTYRLSIILSNNIIFIPGRNNTLYAGGRSDVFTYIQMLHKISVHCWNYILNIMYFKDNIPKMHHIALPTSSLITEPRWGIYTYKEIDLGYKDETLFSSEENSKANDIIRRLAYHLFANIITVDWWDYVCLHNGMATFFGMYITDKAFVRQFQIMNRFVVEEQQELLSKDVAFHVEPVIRKINTSDQIDTLCNVVQKKATALIRMLYHIISDVVYQKVIHTYLEENQFNLALIEHFWNALRRNVLLYNVDLKTNNESLKTVMDTWLTASNYPILCVKHVYKSSTVQIWQNHLLVNKEEKEKWFIPITYTTDIDINFKETAPILWLKPLDTIVEIRFNSSINWIIFNLQQTGYYRVNYNNRHWQRIITYLKSNNYTNIHPNNRAQLIDDSYHLMLARNLSSDIFLSITRYLIYETDYIPWYPMKRILANMSIFFQFPESKMVKDKMTVLLQETLEMIDIEDYVFDPTFTRSLRIMLAELLCNNLGENGCLQKANNELISFLKHGELNAISATWRKWILCTGMKISELPIWDKMLDIFQHTDDTQYLEHLACVEKSSIIIHYIQKLLSHHLAGLRNKDRSQIIRIIIEKHSSKDEILEYILKNYDNIKIFVPFTIINLIINNVYKVEHFDKIKQFVNNHTFSEEEMQFHKNFKEYLLSSIANRSDKLLNEVKMFVELFYSRKTKVASV